MKQLMRRVTKGVLAGAATCGVLAYTSVASAEPRTHDGFYMQLEAGLGYMSTSVAAGGQDFGSFSGLTVPAGLLLGGTVGPVAFGGGFFYDHSPSPSFEAESGASGDLDVALTLIGIGMFADIYPNPNEGLHFQPFVGLGFLEATAGGNSGGSDPTGLILAIGGGYDWWMADEWSIGVMGRLAYAPLSLDRTDYTTIAPSVLATFTFH